MNEVTSCTRLNFPADDDSISTLHIGEVVLISGVILTARDRAHKWLFDKFIAQTIPVNDSDLVIYSELMQVLHNSCIYHCGPIVSGSEQNGYTFLSAGPTTSMREEVYQSEIIQHFHLRGIIGKGGMGANTLSALEQERAVYLHAVGGAAVVIAETIKEVLAVYKLEFGVPEAMWLIRVEDFPAIVTMNANGESLHTQVKKNSGQKLEKLLNVRLKEQ